MTCLFFVSIQHISILIETHAVSCVKCYFFPSCMYIPPTNISLEVVKHILFHHNFFFFLISYIFQWTLVDYLFIRVTLKIRSNSSSSITTYFLGSDVTMRGDIGDTLVYIVNENFPYYSYCTCDDQKTLKMILCAKASSDLCITFTES